MITFKNEAEAMEFIEAYMASPLSVRQFCLSLVAPKPWKPEREIKVGDTFSCSDHSKHGDEEFTAKRFTPLCIVDINDHYHAKKDCTFRSRPHKPELEKRADDVILEIKKVIKEWENK